jgi:hypothetical protein
MLKDIGMKRKTMVDFLKNFLKGRKFVDRVYLRDDLMLQRWMFVNFLSLLYYYRVYMKLREAELLKKYSVKDLIIHLRRIYKLKIDNKWVTSEIPKTSRKIIEKLNFNLHIT